MLLSVAWQLYTYTQPRCHLIRRNGCGKKRRLICVSFQLLYTLLPKPEHTTCNDSIASVIHWSQMLKIKQFYYKYIVLIFLVLNMGETIK